MVNVGPTALWLNGARPDRGSIDAHAPGKFVGAQRSSVHRLAADGYGDSGLLKCSNKREIGVSRVICNDRRRRSVNNCDDVAYIRNDTTCRKQVEVTRHFFE